MTAACACSVVVLLCTLATAARADETVGLDKALPIIKAIEGKTQIAQWKVLFLSGLLKDVNDPTSREVSKERSEGWVVLEPTSGRYRVEIETVQRWHGGVAPYAANRYSHSFDLKSERGLRASRPGTTPPAKDSPGQGEIWAENGEFMRLYRWMSGAGFFPPYFVGRRLSDVLQEERDSLSISQSDERWKITFRSTTILSSSEPFHFEIIFDPSKGMTMGCTVFNIRDGKPVTPWRRIDIEAQRVSKEFWAPKVVRDINLFAKTFDEIGYSDVKINNPVDESIFRVAFPPGTSVHDHINNTYYDVGAGPEGDQEAIRAFIKKEGLDIPVGATVAVSYWKVGLLVAILAAVGVVGFLTWKSVKRRTALVMLIVIPAALLTGAVKAGEPRDRLVDLANDDFPISQCGFNVSVFALEYFQLRCNARHVAVALRPTNEGTPLSDVQNVLRAHGLEAIGRQRVTMNEIKKSLKPGVLCIIPLNLSTDPKIHHYVVAVRHHERGPLLVDVPRGTQPLVDEKFLTETQAQMEEFDRTVLFVSSNRTKQAPLAGRVTLSPSQIDLGTFSETVIKQDNVQKLKFTVQNAGETPVMVSHVTYECSCFSSQWNGGLLGPREAREVSFTVARDKWPFGKHRKNLNIVFGDASQRAIELTGDRPKPAQLPFLLASRKAFTIDVTDMGNKAEVIEREALMHYGDKEPPKIDTSSTVAWATGSVKPADSGTLKLSLRISVTPDLFQDKEVVEGEVVVSAGKDRPHVPIKITLIRREFFQTSPSVLQLERRAQKPQEAVLSAVEGRADGVKVLKGWSEPAGLNVSFSNRDNGTAIVSVDPGNPGAPGYYLVKCLVQSTRQQQGTASFVVQLRE